MTSLVAQLSKKVVKKITLKCFSSRFSHSDDEEYLCESIERLNLRKCLNNFKNEAKLVFKKEQIDEFHKEANILVQAQGGKPGKRQVLSLEEKSNKDNTSVIFDTGASISITPFKTDIISQFKLETSKIHGVGYVEKS